MMWSWGEEPTGKNINSGRLVINMENISSSTKFSERAAKSFLISLGLLAIVVSGCQTSVSVQVPDNDLTRPTVPADLKIALLARATDVRDKPRDQVGRQTTTLIMLPAMQVTPENGRLDRIIPANVRSALQVAGYQVRMVENLQDAAGPVVVVQIDELKNYLFSGLYPVGFVWGRMELSLQLMTPDGHEIWKGKPDGNWGVMPSLFYMSGFETRVQSDLRANLNQIIEIVSSNDFKKQLKP